MQKLISILTSTYNCGHLINRLLDSILRQTYNNIEMFVIDDGSTDNTKQVMVEYSEKFQKRGYTFKYIYQENQGQSVAINNGLKLIRGDYLVWPDADDFYAEPNSLELLASALDNTDDNVGCSTCFGYLLDENTLSINRKIAYRKDMSHCAFEEYLLLKNFHFAPIFYMIKASIFFNEIEGRTIYTEKNAGQNYQILLPILYNRKCIIVKKYLCNVLERDNSHCRVKLTYEKSIERIKIYLNTAIIVINNIKSMPEKQKKYFISQRKNKFFFSMFYQCFYHRKKKEAKNFYRQLAAENISLPIKVIFYYRFCSIPFGFVIYNFGSFIYKTLRRKFINKIM